MHEKKVGMVDDTYTVFMPSTDKLAGVQMVAKGPTCVALHHTTLHDAPHATLHGLTGLVHGTLHRLALCLSHSAWHTA